MKAFAQFYNLYLSQGMTPGEVLARHPEWKSLWYDAPDGQYGRPAAFYQQLQALNLGQAWQDVKAPVFVVYGTGDSIMSRADSDAISETVNRVHLNAAQNCVVEHMDHLFTVNGKFYDPLVPAILQWIKERLAENYGASAPYFSVIAFSTSSAVRGRPALSRTSLPSAST